MNKEKIQIQKILEIAGLLSFPTGMILTLKNSAKRDMALAISFHLPDKTCNSLNTCLGVAMAGWQFLKLYGTT